ncbi:hypothetical protein JCM6882_004077 [Rhodosporidiobolus microsporus]
MAPIDLNAGLATLAIHADGDLSGPEVSPAISTTTTFRHPSLEQLAAAEPGTYDTNWDPAHPSRHIYSRETQPVVTRVERILETLIGGPTIIYASGIAACFAILLHVRPDCIAVTGGYFGCHGAFEVYQRTRGKDQVSIIALEDEFPKDKKVLCWLETPVNPTGESRSIAAYSAKTKAVNGVLAIDSTFGPPTLQDPFKWGADIVLHSATKYLGGASDLLAGTVSVKDPADWHKLWDDRVHTGATAGSLDSWLLLRSLRTLTLRVRRQATTATALAQWLSSLKSAPNSAVEEVWHTSLQEDADELIGEGKQMAIGPACFGMLLKTGEYATNLPHQLKYFVPATSLGGVESLIEQRVISDPKCDPRLIRLNIGVEDFEDLKADLEAGLKKVVEFGR